ncbi:hypothetical protein BGW80DRAFT_852902 [Lactifluus volemus]|nr:hypothetical protein BGW80DRAFT_852902 [Lactifluus volemus]
MLNSTSAASLRLVAQRQATALRHGALNHVSSLSCVAQKWTIINCAIPLFTHGQLYVAFSRIISRKCYAPACHVEYGIS